MWPAGREVALDLAGEVGRHGREDQLRPAPGHALLDDRIGHLGRRRAFELPGRRVAVALAGAAVARRQPRDLEPGMVLQELDEPLSHRAGGAQDADLDLSSWSPPLLLRRGLQAANHLPVEADGLDQLPLGHPLLRSVGDMDAPRPEEEGLSPGAEPGDVRRVLDHGRLRSPGASPAASPGSRALVTSDAGQGLAGSPARSSAVSPTVRIRTSARAWSAMTLEARPPEIVPMFRVVSPSTGSDGSGTARSRASASSSRSMADSPSSGYAECAIRPAASIRR